MMRGEVPQAVTEMMARSGGFNVPHDFFKPAAQAILPATPMKSRSPWPRYVWVAGALAAVGIVALILANGSDTGATPATSGEAAPIPASVPTATAKPEVKTKSVALAASPESAVAVRDGKELTLPTVIDVEEGASVELEVRAAGYQTMKLSIDGSQPSTMVKLLPIVHKTTQAVRPVGTQPRTTTGGKSSTGSTSSGGKSSEIVDPWK